MFYILWHSWQEKYWYLLGISLPFQLCRTLISYFFLLLPFEWHIGQRFLLCIFWVGQKCSFPFSWQGLHKPTVQLSIVIAVSHSTGRPGLEQTNNQMWSMCWTSIQSRPLFTSPVTTTTTTHGLTHFIPDCWHFCHKHAQFTQAALTSHRSTSVWTQRITPLYKHTQSFSLERRKTE